MFFLLLLHGKVALRCITIKQTQLTGMNNRDLIVELLNKFHVEGEKISSKDLQQLYILLSDEQKNDDIAAWMKEQWEQEPEKYDDIDYDRIFSKIEQTIAQKATKRRSLIRTIQRYAAVLLIPFIGLSCFLLVKNFSENPVVEEIVQVPAEQEYYTPAGLRSKIILSDGTSVWLNASSRLIIKEGFGVKSRNVTLVGEAFFDVTTNENLPFVVGTSDMDIKALGTTFNVLAYPDDEVLEAVLVEGKIEVQSEISKEVEIQPEQLVRFNKKASTLTIVDNVDTDLYTSWTRGMLVFRKTPMEDMARVLERWFNVDIVISGESLKKYQYTGIFDNRTIDQIMSYIALSSSITYKKDKDQITLYGKPLMQ